MWNIHELKLNLKMALCKKIQVYKLNEAYLQKNEERIKLILETLYAHLYDALIFPRFYA
jgi:hypothetical protein